MRRTLPLLVIAAALLAVALLAWWRRAHPSSPAAATAPAASPNPPSASGATSPPPPSGKRITRLTPERRAELASQIQAARSARPRPALPASASSPPASSTGEDMSTSEQVLGQFLKLADEIKGYVKDCAPYAPTLHAALAKITLVGDPDVGTLIDAPDPVLGDGAPAPAAFDECIRNALQTLELPPMRTGDAFKVSFELTF